MNKQSERPVVVDQEPVAWAALETLEGRKIVRELQDPYEYRPWDRQRGANIRRNLNMVPLYATPARVTPRRSVAEIMGYSTEDDPSEKELFDYWWSYHWERCVPQNDSIGAAKKCAWVVWVNARDEMIGQHAAEAAPPAQVPAPEKPAPFEPGAVPAAPGERAAQIVKYLRDQEPMGSNVPGGLLLLRAEFRDDVIAAMLATTAQVPAPAPAEQEWHDDKRDQWSAEIDAAHPMRTGKHEHWATAMTMVGNRRDKGALVELVNWLLAKDSARTAGEPE